MQAGFSVGKPVAGSDRYDAVHASVKWQFSAAENLADFKSDPIKYAPQYGGLCAWGTSVDELFDIDPANGWKIVDGKLYLNINGDINATFSKDQASFIAQANQNWLALNK